MAVTQAAGEHLGAAEEEQGELKDKKRYLISEEVERNAFQIKP